MQSYTYTLRSLWPDQFVECPVSPESVRSINNLRPPDVFFFLQQTNRFDRASCLPFLSDRHRPLHSFPPSPQGKPPQWPQKQLVRSQGDFSVTKVSG